MKTHDKLEDFQKALEEALYYAEMNTDLIRVRPLLRRALNITNDTMREKHETAE